MRLTLRTLLAYLDDRLPPANAREIGQKVAQSPFATELVERIREVKRRRRLATAEFSHAVVDANLIAEYLDDQLTPDLVARVEKEVLSSDVLLAEVASAHEILGMLNDPVVVDGRLRDRLYSLDPTGETDVVSALRSSTAASTGPTAGEQWTPMASYSSSSGKLPYLISGVLGFIWVLMLATDSRLVSDSRKSADENVPVAESETGAAEREKGEGPNVAAANEPKATDDEGKKPATAVDAGSTVSGNGDSSTVVAQVLPPATNGASDAGNALDGAEKPVEANVPEMSEVPSQPDGAGVDVAAVEPPAPNPDANQPPIANDAEPAGFENPVPVFLQVDSRVLMVAGSQRGEWVNLFQVPGGDTVLPAVNSVNCGPFLNHDWFGVPATFEFRIRPEKRGWSARVAGNSHVRLPLPDRAGLDVLSGRVIVERDPLQAWDETVRPVFEFRTGAQSCRIELTSPQTRIAIEVIPTATPEVRGGPEAVVGNELGLPLDSDLHVRLLVVDGTAELRPPGDDEKKTLMPGQQASWDVLEQNALSSFVVAPGPDAASLPAWMLAPPLEDTPEMAAVHSRLIDALAVPGPPVDAVLGLLKDRNPQVAIQAVHVMVVTRSVDHLLSVLFEPMDEGIHRAAIDGLQQISTASLSGRRVVRGSLETRIPMAEIEPFMQLLNGLTETQKRDPGIAADLVSMLSNERLTMRTLAIYRMEQATGDRLNYHPDAEASRRREAIRRWQRHLDRNKGQLLP